MEQTEKSRQNEIHHRQHRSLARLVVAEDFRLRRFDEPIAIITPEKIVEPLGDLIEFVFAISGFGRGKQLVETGENFDRIDGKRGFLETRHCLTWAMHLSKARGIPKLRRKIAAFLDLLLIKGNILSAWCDAHQTEAQSVRPIGRHQVE